MSLNHDLNLVAQSKSKLERKKALERILELAEKTESSDTITLSLITRGVIEAVQDKSEQCRERAINVLINVTPKQSYEVLDYVLNAIVARIGHEEIVEDSEELRFQLLRLARICLESFRHDIFRKGYLDHFRLVLENCIRDPYPDMKKFACQTTCYLCEIEPKQVKPLTLPLAKVVKNHGLQHKHANVRVEAVNAFATLIQHGASDILGDSKDEQDNRTSVYYLFILANDHSDAVRLATIDVLSKLLVDITERQDQHRRLLPHVLALLSDPVDEVRLKANSLMLSLGKQHMIDEEDNRIDFDKRRVTLKDIDWYHDDDFPNMSLFHKSNFNLPDLNRRPILGARHVIAESTRTFLDKVLSDLTAVDWSITFSNTSRRVVAMRTLMLIIVYCEKNSVQYVQQIFHVLYKTVRDEDPEIRNESLVCAEILGKFLSPEHYLPLITTKPSAEEIAKEEDRVSVMKLKNKIVTNVSLGEDGTMPDLLTAQPLPTLFSTAASVTKAGVLRVLQSVILGSARNVDRESATLIAKALCNKDLHDTESIPLCSALVECIESTITVFVSKGLVGTPEKPLPEELLANPKTVTLDSMLFYALECLRAAEDATLHKRIDAAVSNISKQMYGEERKIYQVHFGRILKKHVRHVPAPAMADLLAKTDDLTAFAPDLTDQWISRLTDVDYKLRVTSELSFFSMMARVLASNKITFNAEDLEKLIRNIVLVHGEYHIGQPAHLFRKLATSSLKHLLHPHHRLVLHKAGVFTRDENALTERLATMWLGTVDHDDPETRMVSVEAVYDLCLLPLSAGAASNIFDALMGRFDDAVDEIRLRTAQQIRKILSPAPADVDCLSKCFEGAVKAKLGDMVRRLLIHLDDHRENIGIKAEVCEVLKRLTGVNKEVVHELTRQVRSKHATMEYCDQILEFSPSGW